MLRRSHPQRREGHGSVQHPCNGPDGGLDDIAGLCDRSAMAQPNIKYGPITIPPVGSDGTVCAEVLSAPAGHWKIEVVEEGSGFTGQQGVHHRANYPDDDHQRRRRPPRRRPPPRPPPRRQRPPTTATRPPRTTTTTTEPPTTTAPTNDHHDARPPSRHHHDNHRADNAPRRRPPRPTTVPTTTAATPTTTAPTTTHNENATRRPRRQRSPLQVIRRPGSELPWVIVFSTTASTPTTTAPTTSSLPSTGAGAVAAIAVGGVLVLVGLPLLRVARRR